MATRSADVLILKDDKPLAGQSGASFEASNEFEEFVDRVEAAYGSCMTSRELTGQDFSIDMSMVANLTNGSDEDVFVTLWNSWKTAEDLNIKISVKKSGYKGSSSIASQKEDLIDAVMKIETFSGDFEDGLAGLEISLVVNGKAELSARPMMAIEE